MNPRLVVLAGPNGAGKTTFYKLYLQEGGMAFLNADILQVNTGVDAYEAAKAVDAARLSYLETATEFITETVFSDPDGRKLEFLRHAIALGYEVTLIYIGLESAELAQERVSRRVKFGGHSVPADKIATRYPRSLANLAQAIKFVPVVHLFDNSSGEEYRRIATFADGKLVEPAGTDIPTWAAPIVSARS